MAVKQLYITLSGLHAHFDKAKAVLTRLSAQFQHWAKEAAEQLQLESVTATDIDVLYCRSFCSMSPLSS
ncbi:hypothetical protein FACS189475_09240 [Betaproteobacteria bacterium]|nr:hypothetical protein FACS189475_09240 [Betaproteobacteria bacterium]